VDISNPEIADYTVSFFMSLMKRVTDIGIKRFIVHPSGEPISDEERPIRMECAKEKLRALAEYADTIGATICVENLPNTCLSRDSAGLLELLSAHPSLRVCFDTNHLLTE
jgi:sugar phosphate isomerase/epimerase